MLSQPRAAAVIEREVKTGQIAYTLARPYNSLIYQYAYYAGEVVRLPVNLALGSSVAWLMVGPPGVSPQAALVSLFLIFFGSTLNFLLSASIGLLAFWFEETSSFILLYSRALMLLGGVLLPIDLFPGFLGQVARALPTKLIAYVPHECSAARCLHWTDCRVLVYSWAGC